MYRAIVSIKGTAPLSQSRMHDTDRLEGETHDEYDKRTWREKCNYDQKGIVFVPAMGLKQAMDSAAQTLGIKDPDNKQAKMSKYFSRDVICEANLSIGIHKDQIGKIKINANADGKRGSGKRVPRTLPQAQEWGGKTTFMIMEEKIKPEMFERVLRYAGSSIGVGQFRPEKGGLNGRFNVESIKYEKVSVP